MKMDIEDFIQLMLVLLCNPKLPEDLMIEESLLNDPNFQKLYGYIMDLRTLAVALNKGDLEKFVYGKGFVLANLKALQSNLRHLTWQTKQIAEGDFSQSVDFLGDFSDSFNEMSNRLRETNFQLVKQATLDPLTQIPNRLAIDQFLASSFEIAKKLSKKLCILLFDIDLFKRVNDTYGHSVGDIVLIKVAEILGKHFRSSDMLARYGGEEFMAVLPDMDVQSAQKIGERALRAIEAAKIDDYPEISMTISIGMSDIRSDDTSFEDIVIRSDAALYQSKNSGRNRLSVL